MIKLYDRTKEHVVKYWYATQDKEIEKLFPRSVDSLKRSIDLFEKSQCDNASSYGQVIYIDQQYIGDIWIFGIDESDEKMAMLSIVIFDKDYWGKGVGTIAISEFSKKCFNKYKIEKDWSFYICS